MLPTLGWVLQVLALAIVAAALLIGLFQGAIRAELVMLAVGGGLFLIGRKLDSR